MLDSKQHVKRSFFTEIFDVFQNEETKSDRTNSAGATSLDVFC